MKRFIESALETIIITVLFITGVQNFSTHILTGKIFTIIAVCLIISMRWELNKREDEEK